jgi:3-oxoacyl-[acyl-carrier-protein] synthase II
MAALEEQRVFITGIGSVSPFGLGVGPLWDGLTAGRSAVVDMSGSWKVRINDLDCLVGAPVPGGVIEDTVPRKIRKTMGRSAILSYLSVREAIETAGLEPDRVSNNRTGIVFSSTSGSAGALHDFFDEYFKSGGKRNIPSSMFFQIMSHTNAANIAQAYNITGRVISPNAACSSSSQAVGLGYETIKYGLQDIMFCGGADELHFTTTAVFDIVQAASIRYNDTPDRTPRPFDADRDGTVCGEGAGCLVLESEKSALARGAVILGEVTGFSTVSSGSHIATPDAQSIVDCMKGALDCAGIGPDGIDYVNAHATGTQIGDASEAEALLKLFGSRVPVSSFKGHIGHTLGASGAIELIACLKMFETGTIIPNRNFLKTEKEFRELNVLTGIREQNIKTILKNSSAFGGINTALIIRRKDS